MKIHPPSDNLFKVFSEITTEYKSGCFFTRFAFLKEGIAKAMKREKMENAEKNVWGVVCTLINAWLPATGKCLAIL
jgi:hypothetical protein